MKVFIPTRYRGEFKYPDLSKLPQKITIVGTIQYSGYLDKIKKRLEKLGKKATIGNTGNNPGNPGQVLGCCVGIKNIKELKPDCILYVGDGNFHPLKLAFELEIDVYKLEYGKLTKISQDDVERYKKKKKGAYVKFLSSVTIGIIFTTKSGQTMLNPKDQHHKILKKLKDKYPDKEFYIFISNEINKSAIDNFPFIKSWINTACPRIEEDFLCVNLADVL